MPITHITSEQLEQMLAQNPNLQLIDVRTEEEFQRMGHIASAKLIPFSELPYAYRVLNPQEEVVVVCQRGIRSLDACYFLEAQGFDRIFNVQEGMSSWAGPLDRDVSAYEQLVNPKEQGG